MKITSIGTYKITPGINIFLEAYRTNRSIKRVVREMLSIALIELKVENPIEDFSLSSISYGDQAPWDEKYFDESGNLIGEMFNMPKSESFIVTFYLHYFSNKSPILQTPVGEITLKSISNLPEKYRKYKYQYYE